MDILMDFSEVMRWVAAYMVGGILSTTIFTFVVIPVAYFVWKKTVLTTDLDN